MIHAPDNSPYSGLTQLASQVLQSPVSLFTVADSSSLRLLGSTGWSGPTRRPRSGTYCDQILTSGEPIVLADADGSLGGIRFYAGFPIRSQDGASCGTFSVMDFSPRHLSSEQLLWLSLLAAQASALLDLRQCSSSLATLVHEVRTPLNGIFGALELLDQTRHSSDLTRAIATSAHILSDIVTASAASAHGQLKSHAEAFSIRELCDLLQRNFAPLALKHSLNLHFDCHHQLSEPVIGDPKRISQILQNLIGNAIKFTPPAGSVQVSAQPMKSPGYIRFQVRDTGPGIPDEILPHLFEPYVHGPVTQFRNWESTGLGLAITKDHVTALAGSIQLSSHSGQGTTAQVDLFLPLASSLPGGIRVLVVEDNQINQFVVKRLLSLLGCEVRLAQDGIAALHLLDSETFDVVLIDCVMPGLDGYATTREIRARQLLMPIIAVTGKSSPADREACLNCGMNGLLPKPIDFISLKKELISALQFTKTQERSQLARDARTVPAADEGDERRGL